MPEYNPNEFYERDIRAAEIRGATWALENVPGPAVPVHYGELCESEWDDAVKRYTPCGCVHREAERIVDARRKEPEGFGPYGESK
jgi:hypothetical protein